MNNIEHPVEQKIDGIVVDDDTAFWVGKYNITRIEACTKSGMHADIAYVRVWSEDTCVAEFCQHNIDGVYFASSLLA